MIFLLQYYDSTFLSSLTRDLITPLGMLIVNSDEIDRLILQECHLSFLSLEMAFLFLSSICHMVGLPIESLHF